MKTLKDSHTEQKWGNVLGKKKSEMKCNTGKS